MKSVREKLKKVIEKGVFLVLMVALFLLPINAVASTLDDLYNQKNSASSSAESARKQAAQKQSEAQDIKDQIYYINLQITDTENAIAITEDQIKQTEAKIAELDAGIKEQEAKLLEEKDKMNRIVSSWYMEGDDSSLLKSLLTKNTLSEAITAQEYYDSIRQQIEDTAEKIEGMKAELEKEKEEQNQQMVEQKRLQDSQISQRNALSSQKRTKDRLYNDTTAVIAELKASEKKAAELEKQIEAQINSILSSGSTYGQYVSQGDIIGYEGNTGYSTGPHLHFQVFFNNDLSTHTNPRNYLGSSLAWPMSNFRVTQEYGWTPYALSGAYGGGPHTGIDLTAYLGAPITAAASGTIVLKRYFGGYGNAVVIDHGNGMFTLYGHMQG